MNLKLLLFKTLWGWQDSLAKACERSQFDDFDGLEINLDHPALVVLPPSEIRRLLQRGQQRLIIEIATGGGYTPSLDWSPDDHLAQLSEDLLRAVRLNPLKITLITGSDSWSEPHQDSFLEAALDQIEACPIPVTLETHRSRSLFDPWRLSARVAKHPRLRLTADLSHWCAVTERLMTPELAPVQAMAGRVDHIHARVGHAQGPSVSHPFAPEWAEALEAHRLCWQFFLDRSLHLDQPITITPEFGPDGYMPLHPFSANPLSDVQILNAEMASWLRSNLLPAAVDS
ncbi:sugar phosphate isomerase/epimerase [Synechococcus sp. PROS-9-1]|uniref:sugar phosphate isomerase/epimerase n=1 Tax=Synechococcus sp. PROS-9-1 TaxID=1968775 RepID=UPI002105CF32|nr:sugar phosphate isomerase/epimerase [Synechococcus sp. PROS-9-1]